MFYPHMVALIGNKKPNKIRLLKEVKAIQYKCATEPI